MNHSIYSADRATHCKVVCAALTAAIIIAGLSIASRAGSTIETAGAVVVVKSGKPIALTEAGVIVR